ncbi:MAG: PEGA domain-containing protein [Archangium sp.]|nr:PEGA domain-containing protein [Archangium sp.]
MSRLIPLMCVAVAVSAHAQKSRLVVVPFAVGDGASETASAKFNALVLDELKSRGDTIELVTPPVVKPAPPPEKPGVAKRGPSPEAVSALEAGKKAFDDLRFEDAVANLRKGIAGMLSDPATADYEGVTDAYVKLAAAAFRMGEEKEAKNALIEFARFAPNYELSAGFPPIFQREFDKAKKRLDKQPKGTVSIEGPSGSTAFLDGRDLGMVPVLDEIVPGGTHYVKVEGTKGEKFGQTINVTNTLVKVKASFGGPSERGPVVAAKPVLVDPAIASSVDNGTSTRLNAYLKAVNADWALVGYVYKTSDSQLTAGTALYAARRQVFLALTPVSFDTDVLTANTEAFKLGEEIVKRLVSFGTVASLPLNLATRPARGGTTLAMNDTPTNPDEIETAGPKSKKVVLVPQKKVEEQPPPDMGEKPPEDTKPEVKSGVPVWVWVVTGVAVAAGAGVGGYFGITALTKPVTGTVTATW